MPQYREGQIADGPNGPMVYSSANGWQPVRQGSPAQGVIPLGPRDTSRGASQSNEAERLRMERIRLMADLETKGLTLDASGNVVPLQASSAPGDPTKTGEEYLATLPPELRQQVKLLADGRMPFPTGAALRNPKIQQIIAAAAQYDPSLDAANAQTRIATRKNFTSGKARANITAMNTALGHLGTLQKAASGLDNSSWRTYNSIGNWLLTETGDPRVKNFTVARDAVASELLKVFRQTGGSLAEIEEWKKNIDSSDSPEQLNATIQKGVELLGSRLQAMGDEYNAGMGKSDDPISLLNKHAQDVYNHLAAGGDGNVPNGNPFTGLPSKSNGGGGDGGFGEDPRFAGKRYNENGREDPQGDFNAYGQYRDFPAAQASPDGALQGSVTSFEGQPQESIDNWTNWTDRQGRTRGPDGSVLSGWRGPGQGGSYENTLQRELEKQGQADPMSNTNLLKRYAPLSSFQDEGAGALSAAAAMLRGDDPSTSYQWTRDFERMRQTNNEQGQGLGGSALGVLGDLSTAAYIPMGEGIPGAIRQGAVFGGIEGFGRGRGLSGSALSALGGAAGGTVGGGVGGAIGKYAVAPVARRLSNTALGRTTINKLSGGRFEPVPNPTTFESTLNKINPNIQDVRANLQAADELGVPYALADADPRLRLLAGKVSRATPEARAMAENYLEPRNLAQVDRFGSAVERNLAPKVDVAARSAELKGLASSQSRPLYEEAFAQNQPAWSPRIQQFLEDPLSGSALAKNFETQRLEALAQGGKFSPEKLSVTGFDEAGNPILSKTPNLRAVDAIRRGYGEILDELPVDAFGRQIHTGRSRAIAMNKDALTSELDNLTNRAGNRAYADARETYGNYMGMKDALETGFKQGGNSTVVRDVERTIAGLKPNQLSEYQTGYATKLIDNANKQRFTADPWTGNFGTPNQQAAIASVFPNGVQKMGRHYALERDMARTTLEVLGGSPTAARQSIDAALGNPALQAAGDVAGHAMTGVPGMGTVATKGIGLFSRRGIEAAARKNSEQLAPLLFNDAQNINAMGLIDALLANNARRAAAANQVSRRVGLIGSILSPIPALDSR